MSYGYPLPIPDIPPPSKVQEMKYDVFINFRGVDTRENIVSHIKIALDRKGLDTFCDTDMGSGKDITPTVLKAIGKSLVSLVIFSKNYANSPWCLEELVRIMECKKIIEQKVVPVFYYVSPSDVENLTGTFGDALEAHEKNPKYQERVHAWRTALKEAASIAGFDSKEIRPDAKLVYRIVKEIDRITDKEYASFLDPPVNGYPTPYMDPPMNAYPNPPYMDPTMNSYPNSPYMDPPMNDYPNSPYMNPSMNTYRNSPYIDSPMKAYPNSPYMDPPMNAYPNSPYMDPPMNAYHNSPYMDPPMTAYPNSPYMDDYAPPPVNPPSSWYRPAYGPPSSYTYPSPYIYPYQPYH